MKIKHLIILSAFSLGFMYINVMQMSFVIAEKAATSVISADYTNLNNNISAKQYNKFNPLYSLNIGCLYSSIDSICSKQLLQALQGNLEQFNYLDSSSLFLKEAYKMFPEEPVFALNYSLAELLDGNTTKAIDVLEPFTIVEDNILELLCVLGLCYETAGCCDMASGVYHKVVSYFPEIVYSDFFKDLQNRDSIMANTILDSVVISLQTHIINEFDPIIASKLGTILYYLDDLEMAEKYLMEAINQLPSLNRTWYYIGLVNEKKGDNDAALFCFKKSYSLDGLDLLPLKKLVSYKEVDSVLLEYISQKKISKQTFRLNKVYGGNAINPPYIVSDLESYCRI